MHNKLLHILKKIV